mgnify:FL=1
MSDDIDDVLDDTPLLHEPGPNYMVKVRFVNREKISNNLSGSIDDVLIDEPLDFKPLKRYPVTLLLTRKAKNE